MMGRLPGRIAIVTGSSSGIGRATAFALAAEGAKVVCSDLQEHTLEIDSVAAQAGKASKESDQGVPTHEKIKADGGEAIFVKVDVSNAESMEQLVQAAVKQFGRLDIMINNAGIGPEGWDPKPVWETSPEMWQKIMNVNLTGVFHGTKYAAAQMIKQDPLASGDRGWIVNAGSTLGVRGLWGAPSYCASKGGVHNFTRSAALDCAPHRIHVNAVVPGMVHTHMTGVVMANPELEGPMNQKHPFRGIGKPEDIAKAYVFLASDEAQWMTGVTMPVDGGYLLF